MVKAIQAGRAFDSYSQVLKVMDSQKKLASRDMTAGERVDLLAWEPPETLEEALVAPPLDAPEPSMQDAKDIPGLFMQENAFEEIELQACLDSIHKSPGNW